jgi:hypothetical protein
LPIPPRDANASQTDASTRLSSYESHLTTDTKGAI